MNVLTKKRVRRLRHYTGVTVNTLFKICVSLIFLFPFYWMLITSVKPYLETLQFPPTLWPKEFTISGYKTVFEEIEIMKYIKNTVIVTLTTIVIQVIVDVPAAYAFARYDFKGKGLAWICVMAAFMIPGQLTFMTIYFMFADMGILNTLWPQILPSGCSAFAVFLLRQNFMQIPEELIESARLDNASEWKVMWKLMIPMSKSTLVTTMLFSFVGHWNAYFWPLVMTRNQDLQPITLAIERLKNLDQGLNYTDIMAGNVILILPVVIMFLLFSKKIIQAMAYRGMK